MCVVLARCVSVCGYIVLVCVICGLLCDVVWIGVVCCAAFECVLFFVV